MKKKQPVTLTQSLEPIGIQVKQAKELQARMEEAARVALANRTKVLQNLATALGFSSNKELADEILALPAPTVAKEKPGTAKKESSVGKKRKRHQLTDEIRSRAIALLKQKKTALAVAKEIGISVPSVSKIKKAAGLTVSRDAVKAATAPKSKAKKAGAGKPAAAPGG